MVVLLRKNRNQLYLKLLKFHQENSINFRNNTFIDSLKNPCTIFWSYSVPSSSNTLFVHPLLHSHILEFLLPLHWVYSELLTTPECDWCLPCDVVHAPGVTSLKSTDSPALSTCQGLIPLQLVVGFCAHFTPLLPLWWDSFFFSGSSLRQSCVCCQFYWEFICALRSPDKDNFLSIFYHPWLLFEVPCASSGGCEMPISLRDEYSTVHCSLHIDPLCSRGSLCQLAAARRSFFDIYQLLKMKIHSAMRFVSFGLGLLFKTQNTFWISCGGDREAWETSLGL